MKAKLDQYQTSCLSTPWELHCESPHSAGTKKDLFSQTVNMWRLQIVLKLRGAGQTKPTRSANIGHPYLMVLYNIAVELGPTLQLQVIILIMKHLVIWSWNLNLKKTRSLVYI